MSNFPNDYDDDITLPVVYDNITEVGSQAVNALREAVQNIEQNIGLTAAGSTPSLSDRLGVSIELDGSIKSSALTTLGLVTLPIDNTQISETAGILESKLKLDYRTGDLFNYIRDLGKDVDKSLGWISVTGMKLDPHLVGMIHRHNMDHINVDENSDKFLKNKFKSLRDNTDSYEVVNDLNSEFLDHQWADSLANDTGSVSTRNGSSYPANYGHTASAIYLQTQRFTTIPKTIDDVQLFAEYIDNASIFLYGTRIQNLYTNGISKVSRSSSLLIDGYGSAVVPATTATSFLLSGGSIPWDDIDVGDDIVRFYPDSSVLDNNLFDEQFSLVKSGDILRINYGTVETKFIIKEKKYNIVGGVKTFIVRIFGKNLVASTAASARIDRSLVNGNKDGVLAVSAVNNSCGVKPSLLVGDPRGAQTLGNGFNADQFDSSHYMLYLALFETGVPSDGYTILPGIDVTANQGGTPGAYTLESIVASTNTAFRKPGYNYRFMAFSHNGEFGIMLADAIDNAGFSIINAVIADDGTPSEIETNIEFPNNVIGVFPLSAGDVPADPLAFGINGSASSSPPFVGNYGSPEAAQNPTKLYLPLNRNNYYINGAERDKLPLEIGQAQDTYGDGYWEATVVSVNTGATSVQTVYRVNGDLSQTGLSNGMTVVIKDTTSGKLVNSGRYILKNCNFNCPSDDFTELTVCDSIHGLSFTPPSLPELTDGYTVSLYFDSDSVTFNTESVTDLNSVNPFKRLFDVYIDDIGKIFTHERGRFYAAGTDLNESWINLKSSTEIAKINLLEISPKLRGFIDGSISKITLHVESYVPATGIMTGYLCNYDGVNYLKRGPVTVGKVGESIRFYDCTYIDYIDIGLDFTTGMGAISNSNLDIQVFTSLRDDAELMLLSTCQFNDVTNTVSKITDRRQYGNTSEKDLSTSALDFISSGDRLLHSNGVVRGFNLDLPVVGSNPDNNKIYLNGGNALVNGKFIQMNHELIVVPFVNEYYNSSYYNLQWLLCVTDTGEYTLIGLTDTSSVGITDPDRIITVYNPLNTQTYEIESSTFSNVVNNRKDLNPLYIVYSDVELSYSTINVSVIDVRKYANDVDSTLPLTYTTSNSQGNFRQVISSFEWLTYNAKFNGVLNLKSAIETISDVVLMSTGDNVVIDGTNSSVLTLDASFTVGSNVEVKNLDFVIGNGSLKIAVGSDNVSFKNCKITLPYSSTSISAIAIANCTNVTFEDCEFILSNTNAGDVSSNFAISFIGCSNITLKNTTFTADWAYVVPGSILKLTGTSDVVIENCLFDGDFQMAILNYQSNNVKIIDNTFTTNFDPTGITFAADSSIGLNELVYVVGEKVNNGRGWIYCNVINTTSNITIDNNKFISTVTTGDGSRLTFVNFELSSYDSILDSISVNGNLFSSTFNDSVADHRAAVAIINTSTEVLSTSAFPRVIHGTINENTCNKDQMFIITSKLISGEMKYPGIVLENLTMRDNVCGTIGYWISRGSRSETTNDTNTTHNGHTVSNLLISNNTCKLITCLDSEGERFHSSDNVTSLSAYGSGQVLISENTTSWITVGLARQQDSSLSIINNSLFAYSISYLIDFGDRGNPGYSGIAVMGDPFDVSPSGTPASGNQSICIIKGNNTSSGFYVNLSGGITTREFVDAIIYTNVSAIISNNILKGIDDSSTNSMIGLYGDGAIVTNNELSRDDNNIGYYITISPGSGSSKLRGIVKNNTFDTYTTDGTSEVTINLATSGAEKWLVAENINQTQFAAIGMTNDMHFNTDTEGGFQYYDWSGGYFAQPAQTADMLQESSSFNSNVLRLKDASTAGTFAIARRWARKENISATLPDNVRLISCKLGIRKFGGTFETLLAGGFDTRFILSFQQHNALVSSEDTWDLDYFTAVDGYDTNVTEFVGNSINITGDNINGTGGSTFEGSVVFSNDMHTGKGFNITAALTVAYKRITGDSLDVLISPIVIKYRW